MSKPPFQKHPDFIIRSESPFNGGAEPHQLIESAITPVDLFFVRNHGDVPEVDRNTYRLTVGNTSFALDDLKTRFERVSVPATLQCAGNRRSELVAIQPIPHELEWGTEAVSHAVWAGVRLGDVLAASGLGDEAGSSHVEFIGLDETERRGERFRFGGSIPLTKAMQEEVILAYEMNGAPLTPMHGAPLRAVVPGYIGARSVKWLTQINVLAEPSQNYFQRVAYRLFAPTVTAETVHWDEGLMLGEMNVNSVICSHADGMRVPAGPVTVAGFAIAGGGRQVARVEISCDGGHAWHTAQLHGEVEAWSWRLWSLTVDLAPGQTQLLVRAVDTAANAQPQNYLQVWNFKGYMNNAWHRVAITVA